MKCPVHPGVELTQTKERQGHRYICTVCFTYWVIFPDGDIERPGSGITDTSAPFHQLVLDADVLLKGTK